MLAFLKLRITTLCISPNNPVISVVNLLSKTKCSLVLTFEKFLSLANTSAEQIPGTQVIKMIEMDFEALTKEPLDTRTKEVIDTEFSDQDLQKPALILHR
jgi:hypothetical protein